MIAIATTTPTISEILAATPARIGHLHLVPNSGRTDDDVIAAWDLMDGARQVGLVLAYTREKMPEQLRYQVRLDIPGPSAWFGFGPTAQAALTDALVTFQRGRPWMEQVAKFAMGA